jgi:hypothetical protein
MRRSVCEGFIDVTGQSVAHRPVSVCRKQITSDWHVEPKGLIIVASYLGVPRQGRPETCGCSGQVNNLVSPKTDVGRDSSVGIATVMGWTVQGSNSGGGEIFRTRPDRPWGPPSLLYNGYRVFQGVKAAGHGVDHPPHLAPRLGKSRAALLLLLWAFVA